MDSEGRAEAVDKIVRGTVERFIDTYPYDDEETTGGQWDDRINDAVAWALDRFTPSEEIRDVFVIAGLTYLAETMIRESQRPTEEELAGRNDDP